MKKAVHNLPVFVLWEVRTRSARTIQRPTCSPLP